MTLQYKDCTLSGNVIFICTCLETGKKSMPEARVLPVSIMLLQINFIFAENVHVLSIYRYPHIHICPISGTNE